VKIASLIRVVLRAPVALGWTLCLHWIGRFRQVVLRGEWRKRTFKDVIGWWGAGLAWVMGVRIVRRNRRDWPMGDVIVANHMGFLDVPALLTTFPAVFIIMMEMRKVLYFGKALERQGHVFVERRSENSRKQARDGVQRILERGERIIIFPEGYSSPGAERRPFKPFSFYEAARQGKRVELCVLDYLPDRRMLEWDRKRRILPQLIELFGRRRTWVSLEFFPSEVPADPAETAERYRRIAQERLGHYDLERNEGRSPIKGKVGA
jgi:1-acyl-sn-glycerol-3-phosphate acyltransferase